MRIAVGADHAGYALKEVIARDLDVHGHVVIDKGTFNEDPVDYPDFAVAVARRVATGSSRTRRSSTTPRMGWTCSTTAWAVASCSGGCALKGTPATSSS